MKRALFVVLAAIAALGITALASAAGKPPTTPNNPVITFVSPSPADDATVTSDGVTYGFTYNRTPKQTASVTCALSGPTSFSGPCDTPVPSPADSKNTSKSGESYTGLGDGDWTFTVTLTLTGGGVYTATRDVTVDVPPPFAQAQADCASIPGVISWEVPGQNGGVWTCTVGRTSGVDLQLMRAACLADFPTGFLTTLGSGLGLAVFTCLSGPAP